MKEEAKGGFVVGGILSGGQTTAQSLGTAIKAPAGNNVPLQQNIDNAAQQRYTEDNKELNGGNIGGSETGTGAETAEAYTGERTPGLPETNQTLASGGNDGRGNHGLVGYAVSENAKNALSRKGVADVGVIYTDADGAFFASAMEQAAATQRFGASVDLKTAENIAEIVADGGHAFIAENGSGGVVVTGDGDIEGVFKNRQTGNASTFANLMICAIENDGVKLDCYGLKLVNGYERFGFIPVAQVNFDKNQVNERWDFETQGTPQIYFMLYSGKGAVDTIANMDTVHLSTQKELDVLPEMDYDSAYAYRDRLLAERSGKGAPEGSPSGGAVERSGTEGGTTAAEATAKTDPAAAALQQQYQTEITAALRAGDYQRALALFKEFGNPNLRALNNFQTLKAFGDYAAAMGYDVSPEDISTDQTLAAFEESYQNAIENSAKDGIIAAGTPTDHFDRKARLYGLEEDLAAVNPNFSTGKYEWTHNCQRCVSTLEMRFRGFKVTAKPIPGKVEYDDLALNVELAWKNAVRKWCALPNGKNQIEDYMRRWGDGSRAIVGMMFPSGLGHVFFAMQIDGKTVFVDPQYPAADCEQYFKRYVKGGLYVIRVDNLQPLERITDCCKSGDE